MVPGCWIESVVSFKMSGRLDEIVSSPPERARELLQKAGLNYFLVTKDSRLLDLLPYSQLFLPETIGRYLGIRWTDGSAFLLTWVGPETTPIGPEFLDVYNRLLARTQHPWFQFGKLVPQLATASEGLRRKAWGEMPELPWRQQAPMAPK
jgi:hypothetical protein